VLWGDILDKTLVKKVAARLVDIRGKIIKEYPFFGRLIMHLPFGFSPCETAYTDMKRIVIDPFFADSLSDDELMFVVMHELMHCVLKHCTRAKGRLALVYNIACDIVVNSVLLEAMGLNEYKIDDLNVMHLAPDGTEGRTHSAEEVYAMLIAGSQAVVEVFKKGFVVDKHEIWKNICENSLREREWDRYIKKASKEVGTFSEIPESLRRHVSLTVSSAVIDWKQVLCDFICNDRCDFVYTTPDKRFSGDVIMPSFKTDIPDGSAENIWFLVDTSGSVDDATLSAVFDEIKNATYRIENLSGYISFFDCAVTEPQPFDSTGDIDAMDVVGGGGTRFDIIFKKIDEFFEEKPRAIVILTDGYAEFPQEDAAQGIPVIWIICSTTVKVPWGQSVYVNL